ncbi:MAG: hypothetical protein MJ150_03965 [Clostridia bacterium]|nr:hypothetical protein [Clostridia bacterium]
MKKILAILLALAMVFSFAACGKKEKPVEDEQLPEDATVAQIMCAEFKKQIKDEKDLMKLMQKLAENEALGFAADIVELPEGYLGGFTTDIKDFKQCVAMVPFIGSIPFAAYVFEAKDAAALEKTLTDNHDLRWNICTEADEFMTAVVDNYVFAILSPATFED